MTQQQPPSSWLRWTFWLCLVGFLAWDFAQSPSINLRLEPAFIAIGSGQSSQGGHCSMPD
ncbi:MAG: hypothetical protein KIG95_09835 [Comamonas sp.]|nr:hypothetical protein [Comamonas sp.]